DLEHYALKLLVVHENSQNKQTEIAKELSQSYVEIMIDECQDINEVQNLIFKMLSRDETNIFMVGDIKQSIYRFRKAMPQIFIEKKETFKYYNKMTHNNLSKEKIILGNNFRSRPELTSTINLVFSQIMQKDMGEIEYDQDERLVASAIFDENKDAGAELHIIDYDKTLHEDKTECEARYIAKLINDMVVNQYMVSDGDTMRPCKYSDFAVLLRSKASKAQVYLEKFKEFNVPSWCDVSQGYFTSYEISVMLNLLRIIDNPLKDVALLCVLMSPMFGFSADKITQIRLINKNQPLYLNLSQAANLGDEDATTFLKTLDELRTLSSVLPADRMIQKIYEQTDFISMVEAMFQEDQSSANLKLFLSYANQYEQSEHSGLYGFIRYIDRVIEKNDDFLSANTLAQNSNVVKIMSIHASKGLEFPICIVADCAKSFNKQDLNKSFQLNSNLGFSMKIREAEQLKEYTSLSFNAIKLATEKETIAEEMRVLYVAMTRAREKLIMVMTFTDAQTKISKINAQTNGISCPSPYDVYTSNSFADWLLLSFLTTPLEKDTPRYPVKLINEQEQYLFSVKTIPVFGSQAVAPTLVDSSSISADSDEKLVEELV
ncbi:MAG: 3'-5' exonuclease, partial [Oscillospiraceae bacterium]